MGQPSTSGQRGPNPGGLAPVRQDSGNSAALKAKETPKTVRVRFWLKFHVDYGQSIKIIGSHTHLGELLNLLLCSRIGGWEGFAIELLTVPIRVMTAVTCCMHIYWDQCGGSNGSTQSRAVAANGAAAAAAAAAKRAAGGPAAEAAAAALAAARGGGMQTKTGAIRQYQQDQWLQQLVYLQQPQPWAFCSFLGIGGSYDKFEILN